MFVREYKDIKQLWHGFTFFLQNFSRDYFFGKHAFQTNVNTQVSREFFFYINEKWSIFLTSSCRQFRCCSISICSLYKVCKILSQFNFLSLKYLVSNNRSHILKQTSSFQPKVCLGMCDISEDTRHWKIFQIGFLLISSWGRNKSSSTTYSSCSQIER